MKAHWRYDWITEFALKYKWTCGAEIGAARGVTSHYLLMHCPLLHMTLIDTWAPNTTKPYTNRDYNHSLHYQECIEVCEAHPGRVHMYQEFSHVAASSMSDLSFDFVFIDASHDYENVMRDIVAWEPKVRHMIIGHDYAMSGVNKAVKERYDLSKIRRDGATKIIEGSVRNACWAVDLRERRENEPSRV